MAYHTTIFEDARRIYPTRSFFPMHGPIAGNLATPYFLPSSRLFSIDSQEELDRRAAANAAWAARQRELYAMPGGPLTPEMRSWNGRRVVVPPPSRGPSIISTVGSMFTAKMNAVTSAMTVELPDGRPLDRAQLALWLDRGYYHFLQYWRAAVIELRFIIAEIKRILLFLFTIGIIFAVMLKVAMMFNEDPGEVEWVFEKEYRSWSVVPCQGPVATLHY
ncbi:hypothetical protein FHL15_001704 [Xylaria flabelliformis]|uniref:Uncharacterized protein n=1 Tax=Xylaria flabelliformis TaxID=2512241 RepID=A0A553IB52_9PEZI|nr:hypothetical protein FHL15_001704 [Xylaria flabelliformis]